jgi:FLVCR family MFS transporter
LLYENQLTTGVNSGWSSYLSPNLESFLDASEAEDIAGWLGFYSTLAGCVGSLILGRLADRLGGHMKMMIILMNAAATASFLWFTLICIGAAPQSGNSYFTSTILGGVFISASTPVYYEIAVRCSYLNSLVIEVSNYDQVETMYPVAEGVTTGIVTTVNNLGCLVFLILPYFPSLGEIAHSIFTNRFFVGKLGTCCSLRFRVHQYAVLS